MKWLVVLAAVALGFAITWLMTRRREGEPASANERPVSHVEQPGGHESHGAPGAGAAAEGSEDVVDDPSAFAGTPSEYSSEPGAAEGWHRDAQDEDALLEHDDESVGEAAVPPVPEATPNGDVAGVGDPEAVKAVDAVEAEPGSVRDGRSEDGHA